MFDYKAGYTHKQAAIENRDILPVALLSRRQQCDKHLAPRSLPLLFSSHTLLVSNPGNPGVDSNVTNTWHLICFCFYLAAIHYLFQTQVTQVLPHCPLYTPTSHTVTSQTQHLPLDQLIRSFQQVTEQ